MPPAPITAGGSAGQRSYSVAGESATAPGPPSGITAAETAAPTIVSLMYVDHTSIARIIFAPTHRVSKTSHQLTNMTSCTCKRCPWYYNGESGDSCAEPACDRAQTRRARSPRRRTWCLHSPRFQSPGEKTSPYRPNIEAPHSAPYGGAPQGPVAMRIHTVASNRWPRQLHVPGSALCLHRLAPRRREYRCATPSREPPVADSAHLGRQTTNRLWSQWRRTGEATVFSRSSVISARIPAAIRTQGFRRLPLNSCHWRVRSFLAPWRRVK